MHVLIGGILENGGNGGILDERWKRWEKIFRIWKRVFVLIDPRFQFPPFSVCTKRWNFFKKMLEMVEFWMNGGNGGKKYFEF